MLKNLFKHLKQDYFSKKWGLEWDSRHKWDKLLEKKKFSNKELSDMMFYMENPEAFGGSKTKPGTGNPFVGAEDTFEALEKRLSPESKAIVKGVVTPHFKQWVRTINESGYAKKINPRDFLEGVYIPHFYSGDSKKGAKQAAEMLSKRFSTTNPFAAKFLFEEFQPRMKVAAFHDMRARYLKQLTKKGIVPDAKQMKQINKELASLSNDMFGGQRFELFQNPTNFKALD